MKFDFFTMGGCQFWEDVFFYQKWRIQRNFETKHCRLLDPWDIKRASGSFDACRKAFLKYINIYELPRQKGHMIIMIHGLFDSKNIFKPLWREALKNNYLAAAINYPSTQKHLDSHVRQLDFFLNNLEDIEEVSFVTKGIGGLVLRSLLNIKDSAWQKRLKVKRIVQVSPPNKGSRLFDYLSQYKIMNLIFGPLINDAKPAKAEYIPEFPDGTEFGIVVCDSFLRKIIKFLPEKTKNLIYSENEMYLKNAKEIIEVNNWHWNPFHNQEVVEKTIRFIMLGSFSANDQQKIKKL